jgi:hypothetical protein
MFKCKHCDRMVALADNNPFQINHREEWDNADTRAICECGKEYKVIIIDVEARRKSNEAQAVYSRNRFADKV